jgi:hypothetical protein
MALTNPRQPTEGIMANKEPLPKLQFLLEDHRSDRIWLLLLILGLFATVVSWLDWLI